MDQPRRSRIRSARDAALIAGVAGVAASFASAGEVAPIWGVKSAAGGSASEAPARLFTFDPGVPGSFAVGADVRLDGTLIDLDGLARDAGGRLLGFASPSSMPQLVEIDPTTGAATTIGEPLAGREIRGAMAISSGRIIALDVLADELLAFDGSTGTLLEALPITAGCDALDLSNGCDLAVRADGLVTLVFNNRVLAIDLATGRTASLFEDSAVLPGGTPPFNVGAAYADSESGGTTTLATFEANFSDDLLLYETDAGFTRSTWLADIIPGFNAGRGDLARYEDATPLPIPPTMLADLTRDGVVNGADLSVLLANWGLCPKVGFCCADLDGDGAVNGADLSVLLAAWS